MRTKTYNIYYNITNNGTLIRKCPKHMAKHKATVTVRYLDDFYAEAATACLNSKHDQDSNTVGYKISQRRAESPKWHNMLAIKRDGEWELLRLEREMPLPNLAYIRFSTLTDAVLFNILERRKNNLP